MKKISNSRHPSFVHGMYFEHIPTCDMHGLTVRDIDQTLRAYIDPYIESGAYVRIIGGYGSWKIMPEIQRCLARLLNESLIEDFWQDENNASYTVKI